MDVSMEPVDGIAATRHIVQAFPGARVVMVTQHADPSLRDAAREAGACGYVLKDNLLDVRRFLEAQSAERILDDGREGDTAVTSPRSPSADTGQPGAQRLNPGELK